MSLSAKLRFFSQRDAGIPVEAILRETAHPILEETASAADATAHIIHERLDEFRQTYLEMTEEERSYTPLEEARVSLDTLERKKHHLELAANETDEMLKKVEKQRHQYQILLNELREAQESLMVKLKSARAKELPHQKTLLEITQAASFHYSQRKK